MENVKFIQSGNGQVCCLVKCIDLKLVPQLSIVLVAPCGKVPQFCVIFLVGRGSINLANYTVRTHVLQWPLA